MRTRCCFSLAAVALIVVLGADAQAPDKGDDLKTKADLEAIHAYLAKNHAGKKWQRGPARIDSEELRKAYGKLRFHHVYSSPPLRGIPPSPKELEEWKLFLSLVLAADEKNTLAPYVTGADYNRGLMKVATDDDARIAAAAILSLTSGPHVGPSAVAAKDVVVTRTAKGGWSCRVERKNQFMASVQLNADGKCLGASKNYSGPFPP